MENMVDYIFGFMSAASRNVAKQRKVNTLLVGGEVLLAYCVFVAVKDLKKDLTALKKEIENTTKED